MVHAQLQNFLNGFNILSPQEIAVSIDAYSLRQIKKGEFLVKEGQICNQVAFVNTGVFRSFYLNEKEEESTYCMNFPKTFVTAYSSFITGKPSVENLQAMIDAEVLVTSKSRIDALCNEYPNWMRFMKEMAEGQYLELERRIFGLQSQTAKTRYLNLLDEHPAYIQEIPLQFLASYLGISQRHLSRLRKEIVF